MKTASPVYSAAQALRTGGRDEVRSALVAARARTLALADAYAHALRPSGLRVRFDAALNPPLWEWGHVAWFQEWWISRNRQRMLGSACDPDHERTPSLVHGADGLYDSSRVAHATRWSLPLPDEHATRAYVAATLEKTLEELDGLPGDAGDDALYFFRLVALHEEMHSEAAVYMARALGIAVPSSSLRGFEPLAGDGATLQVPARDFVAGWAGPGFAFDNEVPSMSVSLAAYEIDAEPVTWARFHEFVTDGGYRERRWWSDQGWASLQGHGAHLPGDGHTPNAAAVHLTAFEAEAWCRWAGRRLPTEFEWECAAITQPGFRWGQVWEWTSSVFDGYPGFRPHPYRDYSAPWFGTRRVLRGASAATPSSIVHPRYRNFFEPHRHDILSGFRSCR